MLANQTDSFLMPVSVLFYELMVINIILGVFNLIPVPPLDGSHVLRHFLSPSVLRVYDTVGDVALDGAGISRWRTFGQADLSRDWNF